MSMWIVFGLGLALGVLARPVLWPLVQLLAVLATAPLWFPILGVYLVIDRARARAASTEDQAWREHVEAETGVSLAQPAGSQWATHDA